MCLPICLPIELFVITYMCVGVCTLVQVPMEEIGVESSPLELELQGVVSCLM